MSGSDSEAGGESSAPLPPENEEFTERDFGPEDMEASLNDALSDLERMLGRHGDEDPQASSSPQHQPEEPEPHSIPLLDEVVIPGPGIGALSAATATPSVSAAYEDVVMDESARRLRLATRLASEVEVIVQDRIEAAVHKAFEEIRDQVRNHMDIILPEVVEELLQHRDRDDD